MSCRFNFKKRLYAVTIYLIASAPLLWGSGIAFLAIRTRKYLGYWPSPYQPDPQFIPFDLHYSILYFSAYVVMGSLLIVPGLQFFFRKKITIAGWQRVNQVFIGGWLLILILTFVPPIHFVVWFLD